MKTTIETKIFLVMAICLFFVSGIFAQTNYKIRQTVSMNGQKSESTIYVKGLRKRTEGGGFMGMGGDVATIEQCDLKRDLKISDKKKKYVIEPFADDSETPPTTTQSKIQTPKPKTEKGGVITYVSNVTDTGERKQMFGLMARHIKTSMSMESSPDACMKGNMSVQTDGWYVDLPEFSCPMMTRPRIPQMPQRGDGGGCRDQIKFRATGGGKLGFALSETTTISNEGMSFTQATETLEFSKATLNAILFDIPAGYALTENASELYGRLDFSAMAKVMGNDDDENKTKNPPIKNNPTTTPNNPPTEAKKAGTIRIGVLLPTNKNGGENVSITNLQSFLIDKLTSGNVEAVGISSESDARSTNCDYILSSDFSKLKLSMAGKVGGLFGKVTGGDPNAMKNYDVQVDFALVSLKDGKIALKNKVNDKSNSDVDRAAETVLKSEAEMILNAVNK